jgi:hypothetical protein
MNLQDLDRETAADRADAYDQARRDYVKSGYGIEGDNPELYHVMIDAVSL